VDLLDALLALGPDELDHSGHDELGLLLIHFAVLNNYYRRIYTPIPFTN